LTGQSDFRKFEKARKLKDHIDRIREDYRAQLKDREMAVRQRATAMYLIDRFALRAGNEKSSEEEADTVGCCSLRLEHVLLEPPCTVTFDFLGKDSIRFFNKFEVDPDVFKNLMLFKKSKEPGDLMFDRLSVSSQIFHHVPLFFLSSSSSSSKTKTNKKSCIEIHPNILLGATNVSRRAR
jgi:DNA topoisomerase-1